MTDYQKKQLEQHLWNVANQLRGKMHADEFRDYCLGFIFFKYLSEKMHHHANDILREDGIDYLKIDETTAEGQEMLDAIREDAVEQIGFFIRPSQLFASLAQRGDNDEFILEDLTSVLRSIERSTMGTESEDDFEHLFEDLDLTSTKLGRTEPLLGNGWDIYFPLKPVIRRIMGRSFRRGG